MLSTCTAHGLVSVVEIRAEHNVLHFNERDGLSLCCYRLLRGRTAMLCYTILYLLSLSSLPLLASCKLLTSQMCRALVV